MSDPLNTKKVRVLIIDDRRDITAILKALLERSGYEVETAEEGAAALELARRFTPHALISDLGLAGGMSGFELAQAVRQDSTIPLPCLIAVTGHDDTEHRQRALEAGFNHYLVKPANLQALLAILSPLDANQPASGCGSHPVSR